MTETLPRTTGHAMPIDESKYKQLKLDRPSDKVLRITFDRPDTYNSLDEVGHRELAYIWRDIDDDPSINSVILTGAGKAFSSGGDFSMIEKVIDDFDYRANTWKEARDLVYNVINCSKPIISAINGPAVGAGLVAGLLADISIAGKKAKIVDGHTRLGVAAGDSAVINWPLLCGMAKAKYLLLTCEAINGEYAEKIRFVSSTYENFDDLYSAGVELAEEIASNATNVVQGTKQVLDMGEDLTTQQALDFVQLWSTSFLITEDLREGVTAFMEKRKPKFN